MNCKFCPLVNSNGSDITYDIIVDAIMQIALSLSTKHKADERDQRNRADQIILFAKFATENQNLKRDNESLLARCNQLEEKLLQCSSSSSVSSSEATHQQHQQPSPSNKGTFRLMRTKFDIVKKERCNSVAEDLLVGANTFVLSDNARSPDDNSDDAAPSTSTPNNNQADNDLQQIPSFVENVDALDQIGIQHASVISLANFSQCSQSSFADENNSGSLVDDLPSLVHRSGRGSHNLFEQDFMGSLKTAGRPFTNNTPSSADVSRVIPSTLECHVCGLSSTKKTFMKRHYLKHHPGEKPFPCEFCGRRFNDWNNYKKHRFVHTRETRFTCDVCGKNFSRRDNYKTHLLMHQRSDKQGYRCEECGEKFNHLHEIRSHTCQQSNKNETAANSAEVSGIDTSKQ